MSFVSRWKKGIKKKSKAIGKKLGDITHDSIDYVDDRLDRLSDALVDDDIKWLGDRVTPTKPHYPDPLPMITPPPPVDEDSADEDEDKKKKKKRTGKKSLKINISSGRTGANLGMGSGLNI